MTNNLTKERILPVAYVVGDMPTDLAEWVQARGVEIRGAEPLIASAPHCNKIIPFGEDWSLHPWAPTDVAVVDLDMFFLSDPTPYLGSLRFRAPPNNHSLPPPQIWRDVLKATGLGRPYRPGLALMPGEDGLRETHVNNICGSFVVAPVSKALPLRREWERWARWLVENRSLLDRWNVHVDQVSFALAMEAMGEDVEHFPSTLNAILHLLPALETPIVLHLSSGHIPSFPQSFRPDGCLRPELLKAEAAGWVAAFNLLVLEAVQTIEKLASLRGARGMFLNPSWRR